MDRKGKHSASPPAGYTVGFVLGSVCCSCLKLGFETINNSSDGELTKRGQQTGVSHFLDTLGTKPCTGDRGSKQKSKDSRSLLGLKSAWEPGAPPPQAQNTTGMDQ